MASLCGDICSHDCAMIRLVLHTPTLMLVQSTKPSPSLLVADVSIEGDIHIKVALSHTICNALCQSLGMYTVMLTYVHCLENRQEKPSSGQGTFTTH